MSNGVVLFNGASMGAGGSDLLNGLIGDLLDQDEVSANYDKEVMQKLGLTYTVPLSPDETFDSMVGASELDEVEESEDLPMVDLSKAPGKGFKIKLFGGQYKVSKLFVEWVKKAKTLEEADSSVKKEWARIARRIKQIDKSKVKTKSMLFAKLFTLGFSNSALNGPGSLTPEGRPLFDTLHPYMNGTKFFSNIVANNPVLSNASLKEAIRIHKEDIRLQNGDYVAMPESFDLLVPRELETSATEILNNGSKYAADGNNSAKENVFRFEGSRVNLVVVPQFNFMTKSGSSVGSKTMWFLFNREVALESNALRYLELYDANIEMYKNNSNKDDIISIDLGCTVDHYGAQYCIVGSKGDNSAT